MRVNLWLTCVVNRYQIVQPNFHRHDTVWSISSYYMSLNEFAACNVYVVNIKCSTMLNVKRTRETEYPPHLQLLPPSPITIKKSSLDKYNKNNGCPSH